VGCSASRANANDDDVDDGTIPDRSNPILHRRVWRPPSNAACLRGYLFWSCSLRAPARPPAVCPPVCSPPTAELRLNKTRPRAEQAAAAAADRGTPRGRATEIVTFGQSCVDFWAAKCLLETKQQPRQPFYAVRASTATLAKGPSGRRVVSRAAAATAASPAQRPTPLELIQQMLGPLHPVARQGDERSRQTIKSRSHGRQIFARRRQRSARVEGEHRPAS
jgi:hypothetical protein